MERLMFSLLLGTIFSAALSQEPIDRERFVRMAAAVCDHDALASAFTLSAQHDGPVLYVQFPAGISGVHPEEMFDVEGRHGRIVFAHKKYIFFLMVKHWLVFQDIEVSMDRALGYFRSYNHVDAEMPTPIVKGSVSMVSPDATWEPTIRLLKKIPSDKAFKR